MLTIRHDQVRTLETDYKRRRRAAILRRIRSQAEHDEASVDDEEALRRIDAAIEDGKSIGITHDDDVVRLASLAFLPDTVREDPLVVRIMTRVLCRQDWTPSARLDFIEAHVI